MSENEDPKGAGMIPWTEADSSGDISSDGNQKLLQHFIHSNNQRIIDITNDDRAINANLLERICSAEAVLETQSRNVTELRMQHETLRGQNEYEAVMRENFVITNKETRANFEAVKSVINEGRHAISIIAAGREQLEAANAAAEARLRGKRAELQRMESDFSEERRLMEQELSDLAQRNKELAYIAKHPSKFKETERNEYIRIIENSAKELEQSNKYIAELENYIEDRQKSASEIGRRCIALGAELRAVQRKNESKIKELATTIANQENIIKEEDREIESLKMRIESQVELAKAKTAESECYEEKLTLLKESRKNEDKLLEEEEELMKNFEARICDLKRKSSDNDLIIKKQSQDTEELVLKLVAMQEEVRILNNIKIAKELAEAGEEKKRGDEMATLLDKLKEFKREAQNNDVIKKRMQLTLIELLKNVSKAENELIMLTENHKTRYSNLICEKNLKAEELESKVNMVKKLKERKCANSIELKIQEEINIKHVSENEAIEAQLTEVFLRTEEKQIEHKNNLKKLNHGKEDLMIIMEEVEKLLGENVLMDTDLNKTLNKSTQQQDALRKEKDRLRLEAQASAKLLEEIKRNDHKQRAQLESQLDNERKQHESEMSTISNTITEMELHLANDKKTFANIVSEIKKNTDVRSANEADTTKYLIEIKSIHDAIREEKQNLLMAVQEKETARMEKTEVLQTSIHLLENINHEKAYVRERLKYLSKRPNPTGASSGSNIKKKQ